MTHNVSALDGGRMSSAELLTDKDTGVDQMVKAGLQRLTTFHDLQRQMPAFRQIFDITSN